jgi:hypothetical protein
MQKNIIVKYGSSVRNVAVAATATVGEIIADSTTRVVLGYGDNVQAIIGGAVQPTDAIAPDGSLITLENKANQKA